MNKDKQQKKTIPTIGGLFSGIGGIELGFEQAGFKVRWANELDEKACITYKQNYKHKLHEGDIRKLDPTSLEAIDVLTGGFPCQAFSIAGHRKGFEDDRGNVFFEILRIIDALSPPIVFLENVKNLVGHDKGNTFCIIRSELESRGYHLKTQVMNSAEYGNVPQNRERIYIVAFKSQKTFNNFEFPEKIPLNKTILDLVDDEASEEFYYKRFKFYPELQKNIIRRDTIYQWRRHYVRENKSNLCPTLTANMGTGGHNVPIIMDNKDIRKLTPRECARFQGFPEDFKFPSQLANSHLYKQIGNSVTVPVVKSIAIQIKKAMDRTYINT